MTLVLYKSVYQSGLIALITKYILIACVMILVTKDVCRSVSTAYCWSSSGDGVDLLDVSPYVAGQSAVIVEF